MLWTTFTALCFLFLSSSSPVTSNAPHNSRRILLSLLYQAAYAEERLDALEEFQEELNQALLMRKMVDQGLHDRALKRLIASTEVIHG